MSRHSPAAGAACRRSALGLSCNIDRRGRAVRAFLGAALVAGGVIAFVAAARSESGGAALWFIGAGTTLGGVFCLFEAVNGWCALRAVGMRTPL